MNTLPLIVIDLDDVTTIGQLLPSDAALDRLAADLAAGPEDEPDDDGDRWDGLSVI